MKLTCARAARMRKKVAERCSRQRIGCSKDGAMRTVEDIHEEIYRRVTELLKA